MGQDLIGYQTMIPLKLTDKEKKEVNQHLDNFVNLIKNPDFINKIANETDSEGKSTKQLYELSPLAASEIDNLSYGEDPEDQEELIDFFQEIINQVPTAREFIKDIDFEGNDTSSRTYTILGRVFISVFSGENSWGDEPDGGGFQLLKSLDMVGVLSKIENLTIPSEPLSIQFIKGGEDES